MKCGIGIVMLAFLAVTNISAQQQRYTLTFGSNTIDISCSNQAPEGFYKDVTFTSSIPIRIFFQKNDKTVMDVVGKSVVYNYKRNEQAEYVADVTVDGKSYWSTRCIYFVTANIDKPTVSFNGQTMDVVGVVYFPQTGTTFSISRLL
ncbi:hypothetical protein K1X84_04410 [bacterium]|nr:hypothetical protein [bacterium]